jgi:hypothetical protein
MKAFDFVMSKIAEESVEIAHDALKAKMFGPHNFDPADSRREENIARLGRELDDLMACLVFMQQESGYVYKPSGDRITAKVKKLKTQFQSLGGKLNDQR